MEQEEADVNDQEIGGFTIVPDKTVKRSKRALDALPLWWRKPEPVTSDVRGSDAMEIDQCYFLSPRIKELLAEQNIDVLFSVQARVVPAILDSYRYGFLRPRDVCVCTPTGSGKTLSYAIPILELLQARQRVVTRALIVLPSRTLALQVHSIMKSYADTLGLKVAVITGAISFDKEQRLLVSMDDKGNCRSNVDIVIATPGRLVDHITNTSGFNLTELRILVIDEADLLLAEGSQNWYLELERAIFDLPAEQGGRCRVDNSIEACLNVWGNKDEESRPEKTLHKLLFSATLTYNPELQKYFNLWDPRFFSSSTFENKKEVDDSSRGVSANADGKTEDQMETKFSAPAGLRELYVRVLPKYKPLFLVHLVLTLGMDHILVFVNTRASTHRLRLLLSEFKDVCAGEVSANLAVAKRERLLRQFAAGDLQILICTDSISRGMDVENVRCIVSYDAPLSPKDYMHRVGRTARAGGQGVAYTLLLKSQIFPFMREIKAGARKIKEAKFHRSHMKRYLGTYEAALKKLHSAVKN